MIRLVNGTLARMLHQPLYDRMLNFAKANNPEIPAEGIVSSWLERLYAGDMSLHILLNLDNHYTILEHAVVEVQQHGKLKAVVCHQVFRERPNLETFAEGICYIDDLCQRESAVCSAIYVQKHSKALEKKYGYKVAQVLMIKCLADENSEKTLESVEHQVSVNGTA